jgi:cytochrome c oxidase assembly protein subunit 15
MEKHFSKIIGFLIFLTFDLMILGAAVRAMDAGLTCPDWPMCFGRAVPEYHLGVYLEFIHRSIAGILGILFTSCFAYTLFNRKYHFLRTSMSVAFLLLLSQIIMGGLTVLKLLAPGIVTLHLGLAGAFLISLVLIKDQLEAEHVGYEFPKLYKIFATAALVMICGQIILGGLVASNYAGAVCVDFPTCNGEWFPAWTGPIGIQVIHRLGAYALSAFLTFFFFYTLSLYKDSLVEHADKRLAAQCFMLVISQVMVGVLNLKLLVPAWLTVIHLGVALYLMLTILKINLRVYSKSAV